MSSLENCLISTYLLWFSTRVQMGKNWGDTPSATLNLVLNVTYHIWRGCTEAGESFGQRMGKSYIQVFVQTYIHVHEVLHVQL